MPFDSTTPHTTALAVDLNVPSLPALAYALRHRETWPDGFVWDYCRCRTCAVGLIEELWNDGQSAGFDAAATLVGLPLDAISTVFLNANEPSSCYMWEVTPEMVADVIDAHLARAGG